MARKMNILADSGSHKEKDKWTKMDGWKDRTHFFLSNCCTLECETTPELIIEGQKMSNVHQIKYKRGQTSHGPNVMSKKKHIQTLTNTLKLNIANCKYIRNSLSIEASDA